jgi:hypothetical protein
MDSYLISTIFFLMLRMLVESYVHTYKVHLMILEHFMIPQGAAPAYSAKSFLQRAANKSRKSFKQKAGWQNLSESAEYRVTP